MEPNSRTPVDPFSMDSGESFFLDARGLGSVHTIKETDVDIAAYYRSDVTPSPLEQDKVVRTYEHASESDVLLIDLGSGKVAVAVVLDRDGNEYVSGHNEVYYDPSDEDPHSFFSLDDYPNKSA